MPDLLRLPLRVADYGTRPARFVLGKLLELRRSGDDQQQPPPQEPPAAAAPPAPEPPQTAPKKRAPAGKKPSPKAARRATRHEPTHGEAAAIRAKEHPTGPSIEVAQPWDHYDSMTEDQVLDKLTGADPTVRAMVRLYESQHGGRRQILLATDEITAEP
jgi:hypothetical protein